MSAARQGNAVIRARIEMPSPDGSKRVLQLKIKERRTAAATDLAYQVQWPKERNGEAVFLHQDSNSAPRGTVIVPAAPARVLEASQMDGGLFGSDLSYQDAIEDFFAWKEQAIIGSEVINGAQCQIIKSKPGKSGISIYSKISVGSIPGGLSRCESRNTLLPAASCAESTPPTSGEISKIASSQPNSRFVAHRKTRLRNSTALVSSRACNLPMAILHPRQFRNEGASSFLHKVTGVLLFRRATNNRSWHRRHPSLYGATLIILALSRHITARTLRCLMP